MSEGLEWLGNAKPIIDEKSAWLEWRSKGLGSSDAPVLMGVSPWKNIYQLWLDKTGQIPEDEKFTGNFATKRGQELEPLAREMYIKKTGIVMNPENAEYKENKIFRASADGVNHSHKKLIEIKCPGKVSHQKALCGEIPEVYYPQCQWLMMVFGYDDLDYVSWDGESEDIAIVSVKSNLDYQKLLKIKADWFWNLVTTKTLPPTEEIKIQDEILEGALEDYDKFRNEIAALTLALDLTKEIIQKHAIYESQTCGKFKISWIERKGNVDYSKIEILKTIDLDQYRKPATKFLSIKKKE